MDYENKNIASDFYLREIPNVKISQEPKKLTQSVLKTEMQTLRLSDTSQKLVLETLKHVHGPDFCLTDISAYQNQRSNLEHKYWMDRGNLVIKGATDNSEDSQNQRPEDKFRNFAILRLQSYGFHKTHCIEALDYCNGEVDLALQLLQQKYYKKERKKDIETGFTIEELLEQREDEKNVLQSIYESVFEEKILNTVWIFNLKLDYIINLFSNKKQEVKHVRNVKKKEMCRAIERGQVCKFGNKCRFSHEIEVKVEKKEDDSHLRANTFELEIRFPSDSSYPFEPPFIFLKTDALLPEQTCLHICRRLIKEAHELAEHGMVSVYSIVELLSNSEEIISFLKSNRELFLNENDTLFPKVKQSIKEKLILPSHYKKGLTNRDTKNILSTKEVLTEDLNLVKQFEKKKNNSEYIKILEKRRQLPAWNFMNDIINTVRSSQIVVVSGETGCGKSTQVPQFLLDDWLMNYEENHIEIVCTQPRRISAIGVAERVADERMEKIGKSVGYQIRLESKVSSQTRLTFCTTGILLRRLESDPNISSVSHIIVDEVHERSEESDFLLLILKDLLPLRPDLKIILMSATMNANIFCDYFGNVPILEIPGRTFPVQQLFLEDVLETSDFVMEENSQYTRKVKNGNSNFDEVFESCDVLENNAVPKDSIKDENLTLPQLFARYKGFGRKTCKNLYLMDPEKVNLDLIEHILMWIVSGEHEFPTEGSILVFLPGIAEISALHDQLTDNPEFNPRYGKYVLLPLHSTLTSEEQAAIFKKPKNNARKIVLSTNIAETSVTIDDCVFVIDGGKMKEKRFDSNRNMESLELTWVSRANALQRKGRAGRVMPGICIHLFTNHRYKHHLLVQPIPEIHRVPLEQLLLRIKILPNFENRSVYEVLGATIEPPVLESIDSAVKRLQDVGALDQDQKLTSLGLHLAALPVDVRIGKLMLFGAIFCCVDSVLTMAACLSYKSPFVSPFGKKDQANAKRKNFATANSDQLTVLKAYKKWKEALKKSWQAGNVFANENYLSVKTLSTLADIKYQLLELLVSIGFVPVDLISKRSSQDRVLEITGPQLNINGENSSLLSAILCTALYPNVCKVLTPGKSFTMSAVGAVPRQPKPEELRFMTKQDGYVFVHPSSVIFSVGNFPSPYIVYQEKIKTSKVFVRDCCMVPLLPLVLFSGCNLKIEVHDGHTVLSLEDGWIIFQVEKHEVAELLKTIRVELFDLLEEKIKDPCLNLLHHDKGKKIISTIIHIITND